MVRFERKTTAKTKAAIESLAKAKKQRGNYNTEAVKAALQEIFYGKCYICEDGSDKSIETEHFMPHRGDIELKYDWNNLYLSCGHCNSIKGNRYVPILDCTRVDVDLKISFRVLDFLSNEKEIEIQALDNSIETKNTCRLLNDVYYGKNSNTAREANIKRREIRKKISEFMQKVRMYIDEENPEKKQDLLMMLKIELSNRSEFTAFKRWIIRDHTKMCGDLLPLLSCQEGNHEHRLYRK